MILQFVPFVLIFVIMWFLIIRPQQRRAKDHREMINNVRRGTERDAAPGRFLNLHLGARVPEAGKKRLFFANPWAIGFTTQSGNGFGYVVSAASDLLVKIRVGADGRIAFTGDQDTTRYIDLNDPANPATAGANAGKNPQGIAVNAAGTRAYEGSSVGLISGTHPSLI